MSDEKTNTFTCDECGGAFEVAWTDKQAEEEYLENFPQFAEEKAPRGVVCDVCYRKIMRYLKKAGLV